MSYTVLARRYRSQTFDDVVGQDAVAQTLKNALATDRLAHAYLFTGTRGVGKTTMARILAKAVNCLAVDEPTINPCCKCESCIAINEGDDIDVLEIDGASNTGVEHIRELRQNAIYRPARARFKVYIIDEVHMLSVSAFNALLKTLEEPPEHVKFILATTEPNKVLPTILSRCQRFDFRNIRIDDIAAQLKTVLAGEKIEAEDILIRRVARLAHGSMRDALSLLDQVLSMSDGKLTLAMLNHLLGTPRSERIIELAQAIGTGNLAESLLQIDRALSEGLALEQLVEALQRHFRDLMVLRSCGPQTELLELDDEPTREKMAEQAKSYDDAVLVYNITVMEELRRSIKSSGAGRALLEAAIVRLTASDRFSDTKILLEQLQNIQAGSGTNIPGRKTGAYQHRTTATTTAKPEPSQQNNVPDTNELLTPPSTLSLEYLRENWPKIIAALSQDSRHLIPYLKPAQPVAWGNNQLKIAYDNASSGVRSFLSDQPGRLGEIEKALSQVLSQPIKLALTQLEQTKPARPSRNKLPPGAKPNQNEINAAIADANVKQVQQILGGKVRQITQTQNE